MPHTPPQYADPGKETRGPGTEPVSELVQRASQQLTELVRGELNLAQAEMKEKGKRYGKGGGLFGGAGLVGFLMLQALVATAIAALAVPLPVWAAALIVTAALGVIAAVMALTGRKQVGRAAPPVPEQTIDSVKADVAQIKGSAQR
ncbi:phage holin family protein [Streptomyces sp. HD]|uniref:phage holin family protein n=1 Tax=Streptomyces sp. HD TaxID=3020892 RepID=UPI003FA7BC15